jgi:oxygen-independent coproporphyrinogen-3 oxidase
MLGLYIHIPFCARRCPYCDFAVHIGQALQPRYLRALHSELRQVLAGHFEQFPDDRIETIFCGGGTPTSVGATALNDLLSLVQSHAPVAPDAEVTLEGNPEDGTATMFEELRRGGWNRLSMGVQSLDDGVLKVLGRRHTRADVERAVAQARAAGWDNISLDLIYAVPGQNEKSWRETLSRAVEMELAHLSCYSLTIEEGTAFGRRVASGRMRAVCDDTQADFMEEAEQELARSGLARYEVSNYARAGRECRHNVAAWRGGNYLAAGNGAHGHLNGHRWWNVRGVPEYIARIESGDGVRGASAREGEESLSPRQRLDEMVLMGLRLRDGFDICQASQRCGLDAEQALEARLARAMERGDIERGAFCDAGPDAKGGALEEGRRGQYWKSDRDGRTLRLTAGRWALVDAIALDVLC